MGCLCVLHLYTTAFEEQWLNIRVRTVVDAFWDLGENWSVMKYKHFISARE